MLHADYIREIEDAAREIIFAEKMITDKRAEISTMEQATLAEARRLRYLDKIDQLEREIQDYSKDVSRAKERIVKLAIEMAEGL